MSKTRWLLRQRSVSPSTDDATRVSQLKVVLVSASATSLRPVSSPRLLSSVSESSNPSSTGIAMRTQSSLSYWGIHPDSRRCPATPALRRVSRRNSGSGNGTSSGLVPHGTPHYSWRLSPSTATPLPYGPRVHQSATTYRPLRGLRFAAAFISPPLSPPALHPAHRRLHRLFEIHIIKYTIGSSSLLPSPSRQRRLVQNRLDSSRPLHVDKACCSPTKTHFTMIKVFPERRSFGTGGVLDPAGFTVSHDHRAVRCSSKRSSSGGSSIRGILTRLACYGRARGRHAGQKHNPILSRLFCAIPSRATDTPEATIVAT
ncbi:hypothetical protein C8R45DRAFT_1108080 [Mycena sanguinolenta]|nr:hypothetical protein C8R45DRAFT_1108080 [Mycena sanguinolenta]